MNRSCQYLIFLALLSPSIMMSACSNSSDVSEMDSVQNKESAQLEAQPPLAESAAANKALQAEDSQKETSIPQEPEPVQPVTEPSYHLDGEFDWSKIPSSTANIGSFPYISVPNGMYHWKADGNNQPAPDDQPYTEFWSFNKLIMFDGVNVFDAEGKRAYLRADMLDNQDFNQYKFDKSTQDYLNSIGAVLIYNDKIPREITDKLDEEEDSSVYKYMTGNVWGEPIKMYALNHSTGKIFFQIISDSASADIGVIELEGFEQTIKAPTASEIKNQLDTAGKAILHINFDTGKATIKPDGQAVIEQIYLLLSGNPDLKLSIAGHTDNVGNPSDNQKLSESRANTVMYALAGKGIDISRLKAKGFGDTQPIADNNSEEGKAQNRRVELAKF